MNLYIRLAVVWVKAVWAKRLRNPLAQSVLTFRVWPWDCDYNMHINNGRYFTLMDLGRFDLLVRMGLGREMWKENWTPLLSGSKIIYRREVRLWQKFDLTTRLVAWEGSYFVMEQRFLLDQGKDKPLTATKAYVMGGFYDKTNKRFIPVEDVFQRLGHQPEHPTMSEDLQDFLKASQSLKRVLREEA
jgi:acyl-CoA thioesterase FadM